MVLIFNVFGLASNICFPFLNLVPKSTIDDEYANANERDPKILITTSHDPSAPLKQFAKVCRFSKLMAFNTLKMFYLVSQSKCLMAVTCRN